MRLVTVGIGAVSVKVGDFAGNSARLVELISEARQRSVDLLVTPELALSGYSLEDRIWWPDIARRSWETLETLARETQDIAVFVGLPVRIGAMMHNGAALLCNGAIHGVVLKRYLPTYSIFYEGRNWTPWNGGVVLHKGIPAGDVVFDLPFGKVSAEICEDMWSAQSPAQRRVLAGAEIMCNLSASPFTPRKHVQRRRLVRNAAENLACVYAYANLLGCDNSRLVFDGGGYLATPSEMVFEAPILSPMPWTLHTGVVDLSDIGRARNENSTWRQLANENTDHGVVVVKVEGRYEPASTATYAAQLPSSFYTPVIDRTAYDTRDYIDELYRALVLGLRDYFEKVGAFKKFLVALSGGRDSALCLMLAVDATKILNSGDNEARYADFVETAYLPNTAYSSSGTENAARALAEAMGVPIRVVSIDEEAKVALARAEELAGGADAVTDIAKQNLQARIRGAMMLNWANNVGGLVLVTSNLSEAAVGYTTTGGDNQGGYSPINNIPKTLVSRMLEHLANTRNIPALQQVLDIPPSAELANDQTDEADLMPYGVLDDILHLFARQRKSLADCWRILCHRHPEHDPEQLRTWTARFGVLFTQNQWKRDQHPVAMKVLDLDLDPKTGFRFPVTQSIAEELNELKQATQG